MIVVSEMRLRGCAVRRLQHAGDQHEGQGGELDVEEGFADAVDQQADQDDGIDFLEEGVLSPVDAEGGAELEEQEGQHEDEADDAAEGQDLEEGVMGMAHHPVHVAVVEHVHGDHVQRLAQKQEFLPAQHHPEAGGPDFCTGGKGQQVPEEIPVVGHAHLCLGFFRGGLRGDFRRSFCCCRDLCFGLCRGLCRCLCRGLRFGLCRSLCRCLRRGLRFGFCRGSLFGEDGGLGSFFGGLGGFQGLLGGGAGQLGRYGIAQSEALVGDKGGGRGQEEDAEGLYGLLLDGQPVLCQKEGQQAYAYAEGDVNGAAVLHGHGHVHHGGKQGKQYPQPFFRGAEELGHRQPQGDHKPGGGGVSVEVKVAQGAEHAGALGLQGDEDVLVPDTNLRDQVENHQEAQNGQYRQHREEHAAEPAGETAPAPGIQGAGQVEDGAQGTGLGDLIGEGIGQTAYQQPGDHQPDPVDRQQQRAGAAGVLRQAGQNQAQQGKAEHPVEGQKLPPVVQGDHGQQNVTHEKEDAQANQYRLGSAAHLGFTVLDHPNLFLSEGMGSLAGGNGLLVYKAAGDGAPEDLYVQADAPVVDVPQVQLDAFFHVGVAAVAVDLGPAGDAGADLLADQVAGDLLLQVLHMVGNLRPGAYQAHLAHQDIEELGQLVHAGFADEAAENGFPGVGIGGPGGVAVGVYPHAAEFQHGEDLFVPADALLHEEHGAGAAELDTDGDGHHQGAGDEDAQKGERNVPQSLHRGVHQVIQGGGVQINELDVPQHVDPGVGGDVVVVQRDDLRPDAEPVGGIYQGVEIILLPAGEGNDQLVNIPVPLQDLMNLRQLPQPGPQGIGAFFSDVAIDAEAHFGVGQNVFGIFPCQAAVTGQDHMALVKAHAPDVAHEAADGQVLGADQEGAQAIEPGHHHPGDIVDVAYVQPGHYQQQAQRIYINHGEELISELAVALGHVDPQHIQQQQLGKAIGQDDLKELRAQQIHGPDAVQQPEADLDGGKVGKKGQNHVAEQIQNVQDPLILFDHDLPPPSFRSKKVPPFFSQF